MIKLFLARDNEVFSIDTETSGARLSSWPCPQQAATLDNYGVGSFPGMKPDSYLTVNDGRVRKFRASFIDTTVSNTAAGSMAQPTS